MQASGWIGSGIAVRTPAFAAAMLASGPAYAQEAGGGLADWFERFWYAFTVIMTGEEAAALSLVLGVILFAVVVAIMLVRTRRRLHEVARESREAIDQLSARTARAESLLASDAQILVVWDAGGGDPEISFDPGDSADLPARRADTLAFGKWLAADSAGEIDALVDRLRAQGGAFNVMLRTRNGGHVEADGRTVGGRAVLRLRDLAGQRRELAEIYDTHKRVVRDLEALRGLLDAIPMPAWLTRADGSLAWINKAYAEETGSETQAVIEAGRDILPGEARSAVSAAAPTPAGCRMARVGATIAGIRRTLDVVEVDRRDLTAGIAMDMTQLTAAEAELARRDAAHARTLDQVATGVAVFGPEGRLAFHNTAFRELWPLEEDFLSTHPALGEILDRLRAERRLPEQADYRSWREKQLEAPAGEKAKPELWHLPDGRVLRIARAPQGDGGVAWLVEDVTHGLDLESRFVAMTRVQSETLDSLAEGIAVFASDGRLKLHNPAFAARWSLDPARLDADPHVEEVIALCRPLHPEDDVWNVLSAAVTSLSHNRVSRHARLERPDGMIFDLRMVPLPDGGTLAVFTDMSDTVKIERALRDRNEALLAAERVKNEFVHKVSYELRAPLTNIIGFAQLISEDTTGPLNDRQREYTGYILGSSGALLAIVNDILDLATIDAGVMELDIATVDAAAAAESASDAIRDRVAEAGVSLETDIAKDIGTFEADEKRVRQVLFNLLSNAVGFSEPGQAVRLEGGRRDEEVEFVVTDQGPGIPEDVRSSVFERFESHALGTSHRGVGLGLSIVRSFVELHGGGVSLDTTPGTGTRVTVRFPQRPPARRTASPATGVPADVTRLEAPQAPGAPSGDELRIGRPDAT